MRKMRSTRSSPVVPTATEGAMTMAQMMEIMRALQEYVEASRVEQARMHEDLVTSQARNEELNKVTEELRQDLHEQRGRTTVEEVVLHRHRAFFRCRLLRRSRTRRSLRAWYL